MKSALIAGTVAVLAASLLGMGCKRTPQPSPEFEKAQAEFSALYGRHLDEAYTLPEMANVEAQLRSVPADSMDAQAAKALLERIEEGREAREAALRAREQAAAEARAPVAMGSADSQLAAAPAPEAKPDAGAPVEPYPGMTVKEFRQRFEGCFDPGPQVFVHGMGMRNAWQLEDRVSCRQSHPGYETKMVLEDGTKVLGIVEKSQVQLTVSDGGTNG